MRIPLRMPLTGPSVICWNRRSYPGPKAQGRAECSSSVSRQRRVYAEAERNYDRGPDRVAVETKENFAEPIPASPQNAIYG
jgi:hypothetical protein